MNAVDRSINPNTRDPLYLGMSLFSLALVLVGFSRSFYSIERLVLAGVFAASAGQIP